MEKIKTQILWTQDNYRFLMEESILRKHKNLSVTLNELIKNYQYMVRSMENAIKQKEQIEKAKIDADNLIKNYKAQIINAKPEGI